jgi:hypothetical protein
MHAWTRLGVHLLSRAGDHEAAGADGGVHLCQLKLHRLWG